MTRTKKMTDEEMLALLFQIFRDYGFAGTSLAQIAEASGLKKASLYHRFPGGKQQMAEELLSFTHRWVETSLIEPINKAKSPARKVEIFSEQIGELYNDGKKSCLLNIFSPHSQSGISFLPSVKKIMQLLLGTLKNIAEEAGISTEEATARAEQVLVEIQGSLVVSRGLGNAGPFKRMQKRLPEILLEKK